MRGNSTILFLSEIIRRTSMLVDKDEYIEEIKSVYNFFKNDFIIIRPNTHRPLEMSFMGNKIEKINIFKQLGINISNLEETEENLQNIKNLMPNNAFANLMNDANILKNDLNKRLSIIIANNVYTLKSNKNGEIKVKSFKFKHENCDDVFGAYEESDGTLRLFELLDIIFSKNKVYVIDELDSSLHPLLVNGLLKLFLKTNNNNQLIVTTHESKTLNFDLVRRDEIWFTEKKDDCSSKLYSLEEFKDVARFDRKIDKAYMEGRFGGIANIKVDE